MSEPIHVSTGCPALGGGNADTPRTNALLTELALFKETTFDHIVRLTQRHVDFTRTLERENNELRLQLASALRAGK